MKLATHAIENADLRNHLEAQMEQMVLAAYRKQGPRAILATRRCAAVHEAGHTIVFHRTVSEVFAPPHRLTIKKPKYRVWSYVAGVPARSTQCAETELQYRDTPGASMDSRHPRLAWRGG